MNLVYTIVGFVVTIACVGSALAILDRKKLPSIIRSFVVVLLLFAAVTVIIGVRMIVASNQHPSPAQFRSEVMSVAHYANTLKSPASPAAALADAREARHLTNAVATYDISVAKALSVADVWSFNISVQDATNLSCLTFDRSTQLWSATTHPCGK